LGPYGGFAECLPVRERDLDAIIDCAGANGDDGLEFSLLGISVHFANVGLVGDRISEPLLPRVNREQTFHGSHWGNNPDLSKVMALAAEGKILHTLKTRTFHRSANTSTCFRRGEIVGRAVMKV
jgi:propanol-preferring alcohol dehydrogenase